MADIARIIAFKASWRLALALLAVTCVGCATHNLEGRWVGNRNLRKPDGTRDYLSQMIGKVELIIKPGNKFDLYEGGFPKSGTLRYADGKAYLRVEALMGKPIERYGEGAAAMNEELILKRVGPDAVTLEDPRGFDKQPILLKRNAQPSEKPARN